MHVKFSKRCTYGKEVKHDPHFGKCTAVRSMHSVVFHSKHSLRVLPIMTQSCPICLLLSPSVVSLTSGACLCSSPREAPPPLVTQSFMPHTGCPSKPLLSPTAVPTPALPEGMNQGQKPTNRQNHTEIVLSCPQTLHRIKD